MTPLPPKGIRILVIDDEQGMREFLSFALESRGYKAASAENGAEALEKVKGEKFHLILSDVKMPQMNGLTFLEHVKKVDPAIEVIITTGYGTVENAVSAMKKGAYDFVLKPFNIDELYMLIEKALEKREMRALIALYESSRVIYSAVRVDSLLEAVVSLIHKVLEVDQSAVLLFGENGKTVFNSCNGSESDLSGGFHAAAADWIKHLPVESVRPIFLRDDLRKYPCFQEIKKWKVQDAVICPLIYKNQLLGILSLTRLLEKSDFAAADIHSATVFATQLTLAVQNARLYESLEKKFKELEEAYRVLNDTKDQLIQSEKLASLGRLIAGIAHEINNPLTAIIGYTQLVLEEMPQGEAQRQLAVAYEQSQRCKQIVQGLLRFSRRQELQKTKVDPAALIEEILRGLSLEIQARNVQVKREFLPEALFIEADPDQLKTVFSNILVNALHALDASSGDRRLSIRMTVEPGHLNVIFSDSGPGILPENLNKIFDPFFTTKELGQGNGLGLSISYGIIREHGGNIAVQSEPGNGATFIVQLPVPSEAVPREDETFITPAGLEKEGVQNILLIEDEASIRDFISTLLKKKNYQIEIAEDGETGLSKLQGKDYDLILCDYRIPKLNGIELFEKTKQIKPPLARRFLFITGSGELILGTDYVKENNIRFLFKPFTGRDLIEAIQERFQLQK